MNYLLSNTAKLSSTAMLYSELCMLDHNSVLFNYRPIAIRQRNTIAEYCQPLFIIIFVRINAGYTFHKYVLNILNTTVSSLILFDICYRD